MSWLVCDLLCILTSAVAALSGLVTPYEVRLFFIFGDEFRLMKSLMLKALPVPMVAFNWLPSVL